MSDGTSSLTAHGERSSPWTKVSVTSEQLIVLVSRLGRQPIVRSWEHPSIFHPFRFHDYKQTSLEKGYKYELLTEPDLSVKIALIDSMNYHYDPNEPVKVSRPSPTLTDREILTSDYLAPPKGPDAARGRKRGPAKHEEVMGAELQRRPKRGS